MNSSEHSTVQKPEYSPRTTKASSVLGIISIISALIALSITIYNRNDYSWGFVVILLAALPLMLSSLIISIIGLCLSSKTLAGKRLSAIGLILTFSPMAILSAPVLISSIDEWIHDKRYNTFVDGVKFNKEMTVLINYPCFKKETNYTIPDSVTSIRYSAFSGCVNLVSITIPDSVTSIGDSAFQGCINLTSITIPDSVTNIGGWTFTGCASLTNITISDNITILETGTFRSCESLTNITIPDSVTTIEKWVFDNCTSLTTVTIPDSVTSIGSVAFNACSSLKSVKIPKRVTSISYGMFRGCTGLTSITIPNGVTSIRGVAFEDCTSLKNVTIPDSVTSISSNSFQKCYRLINVTFLGDAPKEWRDVFKYSAPTIYRKSEAKGWGDTWAERPVKLISEKPQEANK